MTDHDINKLLAEVAGVEVETHKDTGESWVVSEEHGFTHIWTPLTDHNQMALVEAGLLKRNIGYNISVVASGKDKGVPWVHVEIFDHPITHHGFNDGDKLRAFGEAVVKMEEGAQ